MRGQRLLTRILDQSLDIQPPSYDGVQKLFAKL
jgi:hypothetical protein